MIETTKMLEELYRVFDAINHEYFEGSLPKVFITLQQGKKKNKSTYGTFYPESWAEVEGKEINEETGVEVIKAGKDRFHEIAMSAEYFTRPVANWCGTLCHEMVHLYCEENDIEDTSNNGVYHNRRFQREAEKRDLIIEQAPTIGWSVTTPSTSFMQFIDSLQIDEEIFSYFRDTKLNASKVTPKKRFVCCECKSIAQSKKNTNIICGECNKRMDYWDLSTEEILEDYNNGYVFTEGWASDIV